MRLTLTPRKPGSVEQFLRMDNEHTTILHKTSEFLMKISHSQELDPRDRAMAEIFAAQLERRH
jgi:hypothetical protein